MSAAPDAPFCLAEALPLLERTPRVLDALLRGLPEAWLAADEGPQTWSAPLVVGHLIHGERTDWLPRVRHLREHGETRPFAPFDRFAQLAAPPRALGELLDEFAALRRASLAELAALELQEGDLARRGRHPALGTVTLGELLATWVVHDLDHLVQIERTMAKRWGGAVGPWAAYLRVVR
ncbi:MAG: DinB family protein [Planctomycetes bacterium]|nr:DinB family protein [Planctomycetota bacterium]